MKTLLGLLMAALMLGGIFYQLVTGKLLDRDWRPYTSRRESPVMYWNYISNCGRIGSTLWSPS
jgi:hypothetical protein